MENKTTSMKTTNYRIGNFLSYRGAIEKITAIKYGEIETESIKGEPIELFNDIPLTKEWLIKLGFTENKEFCTHMFYQNIQGTTLYLRPNLLGEKGGFIWGFAVPDEHYDCELSYLKPIQFFHELQNLFFALTGNELSIVKRNKKK
jgi:hypothetical protein